MLSITNAATATKYWLHTAYGTCTWISLQSTGHDSGTFFCRRNIIL